MTGVEGVLKSRYPHDIVDALLSAYKEIEQSYFLGKWKASELDAGHFVEAARRLLEHELSGKATPIGSSLSKFNEAALKTYENARGDDSFRILIPRILWGVYGIRNKRGVGHVGPVSPNQMDSSLILANVKWVLAEFVRITSGLSTSETTKLVDDIVQRKIDLLWKRGAMTRVLNTKIRAPNQVLLLLYDRSPQTDEELRAAIEYANKSNFRALLGELHKGRLIEYASDHSCALTSTGMMEAEKLALKWSIVS